MRDLENQTNSDPGTAIVLWKEPEPDKTPDSEPDGRRQTIKALVWIVVGGMACVFSQVFGAAMVGYGLAYANTFLKKKSVWFAYALAGVLGATFGAWYDQQALSGYLVGYTTVVISTLVASFVMRRKGTITTGYAFATLAALLFMAIDFVPAAFQGIDPSTAVSSTYDYLISEMQTQTDLTTVAALNEVKGIILALWPLFYMFLGFSVVVGSHVGARFATIGAMKEKIEPWSMSSFVAPKWSVVVLVVSASLLALSYVVSGSAQEIMGLVGLNALFSVRFIFTIQGLGVIAWFLKTRRMGCLLRVFILVLALQLEMSCFAVSIVGLIDVWAKFRDQGGRKQDPPPNPTLPTA